MSAETLERSRTVASIRAAAEPLLDALAATAQRREERRDHAYAEVAILAKERIALLGVPVADGGAGGSVRDVFDFVIRIARADSSLAQALRSSFLTAHRVASDPQFAQRELTLDRLRNGDLFAGTSNERSGGASGAVHTRVRRDPDRAGGWILDGEKYYSTGGLYASWFSGSALDEDDQPVQFTVPVDRPGVELLDDFDAVGQRLTASGTTRLTGVLLDDDEVARRSEDPSANAWPGSAAHLYIAAVEAGIAAAVLDDALLFVQERARPIKHSSAERSVDDPYVRETVGEIAALARSARSVVLLAAEELEALRDLAPGELRRAGAAASVAVAEAGVTAIAAALRAAELLFDVGGGTATSREFGFDRHWRNARTAANHNPRQWRAAVAGAFHLVGEEPPTSGLF